MATRVVLRDAPAATFVGVLTTPAHQYPLGVARSSARRAELIDWARAVWGWIIEDDDDGEVRSVSGVR